MKRFRLVPVFMKIFLAVCLLFITMIQSAFAMDQQVHVVINGAKIKFEVPPTVINGSTFVPLRAIFEVLGAKVHWDEINRVITATRDSLIIKYPVDGTSISVNGKAMSMEHGSVIMHNRTLVPLRFIGEVLGSRVEWIGDSRTVKITSQAYLKASKSNVKPNVLTPIKSQPVHSTIMTASLSKSNRSIMIFNSDRNFSINIEHYGVENNQFYALVHFTNRSKQDIHLSFSPSNKKIIWEHSKKKESIPLIHLENCDKTIGYQTVYNAFGPVTSLPIITKDSACLKRNAAKEEKQNTWFKENSGLSLVGSNIVFVDTYVQAKDGSLKDHLIPAGKSVQFIISAQTIMKQLTIEGSYSFVQKGAIEKPFKLNFSIDPKMGYGEYHLLYHTSTTFAH